MRPIIVVLGACAVVGCGETSEVEPANIELAFAVKANGADFACGNEYTLGASDSAVTLSDMKFYVSEVELLGDDGQAWAVTLDDDGTWQDGNVALLDFEDGTGPCSNGTAPTRHVVTGVSEGAAAAATGVRFTVGVPFDLNHQDVAVAASPLNLASMFWSWQGGYKFLRIDGVAEGSAGFRVHVGSTGCEMGDGFTVSSCSAPNRIEVELKSRDVSAPIVLDLDALFNEVDMAPDADDVSTVCMSAPDHAACTEIFGALGLPFGGASGGAQSAFK